MPADEQTDLEVMDDPVRHQIVDLLVALGPMTAADIRRRLPRARPALKLHLEMLESVGRAKQEGDLWHGVKLPLQIPASDEGRAVEQAVVQRRVDRIQSWPDRRREPGWDKWRESGISVDATTPPLTPEEVEEVQQRLLTVLKDVRSRYTDREPPEDAEHIFISISGTPLLADS